MCSGCLKRVSLNKNGELLNQTREQNHPTNPEEKRFAKEIWIRVKRDARISKTTTNNIVATSMAGASNAVLALVPKLDKALRNVRRQRLAALAYSPISEATFLQINPSFNI